MVSSSLRTGTGRALLAVSAAAVVGGVLAGCSPGDEPSNVKGTVPAVVTGDQVPPGNVDSSAGGAQSEAGSGSQSEAKATADLMDKNDKKVGTVTFTPSGSSVKLDVRVTNGLPAGFHAMHIHENGVCDASGAKPFTSAGGHLQVSGHTGHPSSGDLVSLNVLRDGTGETVTTTDAVNLNQIVGKSLVIHEKADNFGNIPTRYAPAPDEETLKTGDAGGRIACGVIKES